MSELTLGKITFETKVEQPPRLPTPQEQYFSILRTIPKDVIEEYCERELLWCISPPTLD